MEYNISEAELPTMVVRYENKLILRSVITGQHLEDLGFAPVWEDVPITPVMQARSQRIAKEHDEALEALVRLYPYEDPVPPQIPQSMPQNIPRKSPQKKPLPLVSRPTPCPIAINETGLPPCKVHRNYCCTYCSFCTQNPRSHLLHQRQVHGIRLSIHCCHHCQYASRYFQKLKRHVKMVHMVNSPGKIKMRNKPAARRPPKPEVAQPNNVLQQQIKLTEVLPGTVPAQLIQPQEPASLPIPVTQKPILTPQHNVAEIGMQPTRPQAGFINPEAFFEAAYRNQLMQQQLQEQRLKEFVKFSNQLNKVTQLEPAKLPVPIRTNTIMQSMNQEQKVQETENMKKINSTANSESVTMPGAPILGNGQVNVSTPEVERKRIYNCRKCSYMTHIKSRYNKHVKYHSMPMIQCDKCEFRTTYKWNLTRHLRSHHGNGLYKCSVCSFSAHMKQSLTSHELNHHSPPVGRVSRAHSKPFRRRRCRVGGSDLVQDMQAIFNNGKACQDQTSVLAQAKSEPMTADNSSSFCSKLGNESLKLVIKREAGTSSYSSCPTANSSHTNTNYETELNSTSIAMDTFSEGKKSSSASDSFSSSCSASPSSTCSNVSVVDHGIPINNLDLNNIDPGSISPSTQQQASIARSVEVSQTIESRQQKTEASRAADIKTEAQQIFYPPFQTLPPIQTTLYSSSGYSDSESEDSAETFSTISANETVPHGLHIAYDSSSPDRKSNSSGSHTPSECSSKPELSQSNDFQENFTTLEN